MQLLRDWFCQAQIPPQFSKLKVPQIMKLHLLLSIKKDFFVCLFIAARAIFQLSGVCHHYRWQGCKFWPMLGAQGLWAGRDLFRATPTATRDLGFYGLIRKSGTHIPQWDSNPRRKDHQIIAPDALTTAPCRWPIKKEDVLWNTNAPVQGKSQRWPSSSKPKLRCKKLRYQYKNLVTRNTHMKYKSTINYHSKVNANVEVFKKN
jgi:hypothetical protein